MVVRGYNKDKLPVKFAGLFELAILVLLLHTFQHTSPEFRSKDFRFVIYRKTFTPVKLLEKLYSLVSGDIRAKVDILLKAFMEPVNELGGPNALLVGAQALLLLAQGQPSSQSSDNVIPKPGNI